MREPPPAIVHTPIPTTLTTATSPTAILMASTSRSGQFIKLHKVLKKHYSPVTPDAERPVLEHLLFASCLEDAHHNTAEEAFAELLATLDVTAEELLADTETLTAVLTYHVVPLEATSETVVTLDGAEVETVNGAPVLITVDGDAVMVNDANVLAVDIEASNGVIHVIDAVLLPPA